jgi:inner membrane protease subunit 1
MRIVGHSMTPGLEPGDLVVVGRYDARRRMPRRGDVVAARPAALGGRALVKRLAGLPHECVALDGRRWQLGAGEFFLLGDRSADSRDSRAFGPVRREELIGPVQARLWPWRVRELASDNRGAER